VRETERENLLRQGQRGPGLQDGAGSLGGISLCLSSKNNKPPRKILLCESRDDREVFFGVVWWSRRGGGESRIHYHWEGSYNKSDQRR